MKKILLLLCLLLVLCSCGKKEANEIIVDPPEEPPVVVVDDEIDQTKLEEYAILNKNWDDNDAITHDFRGFIKVGSLIDLPFVQGKTNDTYLRRDWETMNYDEEGSIFLDSANELTDQNLVIYGHYVYKSYDASGTHKFTPLVKLLDKENYEENKYITLQLQDEIRTYEIAIVFYVDTYVEDGIRYPVEGYIYYYPNFSEEYFNTYISNAYKDEFYDTGVKVDYNDYILTLQTCVENEPDLREIVIAKLINTEKTR